MAEIEINLEGFHVNHLISSYSGTLYDIDFHPKEKYSDLDKFFADVRVHLHLSIVECLSQTPAMKVFLSFDLEHNDEGKYHRFETLNSKGRCISADESVDGVLDSLFNDVKASYSGWTSSRPQLVLTSVLAANLHIVGETAKYPMWAFDYGIVMHHRRFGPKLRHALVDIGSMCMLIL